MKNTGRILIATALAGLMLAGCSKNDTGNVLTLKQAVSQGSDKLNGAMAEIKASPAYSIFTLNDGSLKSATGDSIYRVYIPLDKIKGVFDYKPVPIIDRHGRSVIQFFDQSADNSQMIVRMPLSKVTNPRTLRQYRPADTLLTNNFMITVSDYYNNYNHFRDYEYAQTAAISIDNVAAGSLNIKSLVNRATGVDYASEFAFTGGYTARYRYISGDTTVSSFGILNGDKILYEEKLLTIRNDTLRFGREHQYVLTVGDVQISRKRGTPGAEVFLNGVLQPNATVTIIDREDDSEASVCKKRDILITFEDGTTATVSALIGQSVENIKALFDSLHQVYFAAYVVDWIAYDIYYQRN